MMIPLSGLSVDKLSLTTVERSTTESGRNTTPLVYTAHECVGISKLEVLRRSLSREMSRPLDERRNKRERVASRSIIAVRRQEPSPGVECDRNFYCQQVSEVGFDDRTEVYPKDTDADEERETLGLFLGSESSMHFHLM